MNNVTSFHSYIPSKALPLVNHLIAKYKVNLKVVDKRQTKHGDFRTFTDGRTQITVNNSLNQYQFLLTLIHEIAHHVTHLKFGRVQPHGKEWKAVFQHLMLPFLTKEIYPETILPFLILYLKNPKASTDSDPKLSLALRGFKASNGKKFIFELKENTYFRYKNVQYKRGNKRRTRYECLNVTNKKVYLFNQNVEVEVYE